MTEPQSPPAEPARDETAIEADPGLAGAPYAAPPPQYAPSAPQNVAPAAFRPGAIGTVRPTGIAILLYVITFGIYGLYWFYAVHQEMKEHRDSGLGGALALVLALLAGIVMPFVTSNEVGELYERSGRTKPVSALTGLWFFPGIFILIGPLVWFVKTNAALNDYWRSLGATG